MAWTSLAGSRLDHAPVVLAGPVLRSVTPKSATVWLALRLACAVSITVYDDQNQIVMEGLRQHTIGVGVNLHIVAVNATLKEGLSDAKEGVIYRYNLQFDFDRGGSYDLAKAIDRADLKDLSYGDLGLPSFALPPADPSRLRLLQGSCRKPNADGSDMLPVVNTLIAQTATDAYQRPHQLLLTGDQIYADDVAPALLIMLTDAGDALLGWQEILPTFDDVGGPRPGNRLPPFHRAGLMAVAGFTSEDRESHLMTLGEYLCMYLFVWSDVLWGLDGVPTNDQITRIVGFVPPSSIKYTINSPNLEADASSLVTFRNRLGDVRRALANVPSYMIFDDHEVTDDWNMTRDFCRRVYGNALGRRVVQNGMAAYALCQHWGNCPQDFADTTPPPAGRRLLQMLDTPKPDEPASFIAKVALYESASITLGALLSLHDKKAFDARNAVFHDAGALRFDFTVEGEGHQIIFTDTRTWRAFPSPSDGHTHLLPKDQFRIQIVETPALEARLLLVVLTTNMVPIQPIRAASRHDGVTNNVSYFPDVYEAWDLPSESFDRLLTALTSKMPVVPVGSGGRHTGAVVVLSGDVHASFASRLMFRANKRWEDPEGRGADAVIAQLVASALKKQDDKTVSQHRHGYFWSPHSWVTQPMIRHAMSEGYVGWDFGDFVPGTATPEVGKGWVRSLVRPPLPFNIRVKDRRTVDVTALEPMADGLDSSEVVLSVAPHFRYRVDYLLPTPQSNPLPQPELPLLPPAGATPAQRRQAAEAYRDIMQQYEKFDRQAPPVMIGVNNLGELKFTWGAPASRQVHHIIRWWDPDTGTVLNKTIYSVRLDVNGPNDPEFPDLYAKREP